MASRCFKEAFSLVEHLGWSIVHFVDDLALEDEHRDGGSGVAMGRGGGVGGKVDKDTDGGFSRAIGQFVVVCEVDGWERSACIEELVDML